MKKRLISYVCLTMILMEYIPINALSDITNEVIAKETTEQSEEVKEPNEQNHTTTDKEVTSSEVSTQTVENQQVQEGNIDTNIDHITIRAINDWTVEKEDDTTINIGRYLGNKTDIVIPRTLNGKRVILNAQVNTFPDNVEHIKVEDAKNNEPKVLVNVWPSIESFKSKVNLKSADLKGLDVSKIPNMINLFSGCTSLETLDITGWDTRNVEIMQNTFSGCVKLAEIKGIENIDTSKVNYMPHMFYDCRALKSIDMRKWNMKGVYTTKNMFYNCTSLENINVDNLRLLSLTDSSGMFRGCSKLRNIDVSGWDMPLNKNVGSMFTGCSNLESVNMSNWKMPQVTTMDNMFSYCRALTEINGLDTLNKAKVNCMSNMFRECTSLTQVNLGNLDTEQPINMNQMFYGCSSLIKQSITNCKANSTGEMFRNCTNLTTVDLTGLNLESATNISNMFRDCSRLTNIIGIKDLNLSRVTNMSGMFMGCSQLISIDLSNWRMPQIFTNIREMFRGCRALTTITGIEKLDTSKVTDMENLFYECLGIQTLDLSNWDTSQVTNMRNMFYSCTNLESIKLGELDTQEVNNMMGMFKECTNLSTLTMNEINAPNLTTIQDMFYNCSKLTDLTITGFNAPKLINIINSFKGLSKLTNLTITGFKIPKVTTDMSGMFEGITTLHNANLRDWDISNVPGIRQMFKDCTELKTVDVSNWKTDNVYDMQGVFNNCSKLTEIRGLGSWNTLNAIDMSCMFADCENLQSIDVSSWETSNVNNMMQMFENCQMIEKLDVSSWNTSSVTNMQHLFSGCKRLTEIKGLHRWDTSNVTDMGWMFAGTDKLHFIDLRSFDLERVNNTTDMFRVNKRVSNITLLVLANDDKLVNYDYSKDNRVGSKLTFNSGDGFFNESTNDTTRFSKERFVVKPVDGKDLIQSAQSLVDEDIQKMDIPGKSGYTFNKWVLREETQAPQIKTSEESNQKQEITPEKIKEIFKILNGVYEATWDSCAISVTVPTTIPFQVVTNLKNENADPFISGVLNIKNNNPKRAVKVSVKSFTKDDTNTKNNKISELQLLGPEECSWDTLSGEESITKMALGMYVKSGIVGRTQYIRENPLWLKPNNVNNVPIGIIPNAESTANPSECKLSFVSKHAKNFIGGRSKAKFNLVFKFE